MSIVWAEVLTAKMASLPLEINDLCKTSSDTRSNLQVNSKSVRKLKIKATWFRTGERAVREVFPSR